MFSSLVLEYSIFLDVVDVTDNDDAVGTDIIIMSMDVSDMDDIGTSCESIAKNADALADS